MQLEFMFSLNLCFPFDTICHSKLITKLHNYGIRGNCLELLKSYSHSRNEITKFDNTKSDSELIFYGVPQGQYLDLFYSYYILMILTTVAKMVNL